MDRDDSSLGDRYGDRLEDDDSSNSYDGEFPSMGVSSSVKKEWSAVNAYIPESLQGRLDGEYRDLRYESGDELQKGRHFYPLVIALGLEQIEGMGVTEVRERLEEMEV